MTRHQTYYDEHNSAPPIPSREIFHQEFAGELYIEDFSTEHPRRSPIPYTRQELQVQKSNVKDN